MLKQLQMAQSTGYALVRAMVNEGLLERVDHGWIRLGPASRALVFDPLDVHYAALRSSKFTHLPTLTNKNKHMANMLPDISWSHLLTELVDTRIYRKAGPYRIGFANASLNNPWRHALLNSVHYAVRLHQDEIAAFTIRHADDDVDKQLDDIECLINSGIDCLIISATDAESVFLARRLETLIEQGIPVVALDRRPGSFESFVSFVTASDASIGHLSALWLAEHLGGHGRIWMLSGTNGTSPAIRRQAAALATFAKFPDITIEGVSFTGWREQGGRVAIMSLYEQLEHKPDGVWCDSGLQGVGSILAFKDIGGRIPPHTGGDINKMYKIAIELRVPFVALEYPAIMGAKAVDTARDLLSGTSIPRRIETPLKIVMPRNMATVSVKADEWAEHHVRWDLPDDAVLSQGVSLRPNKSKASTNTFGI